MTVNCNTPDEKRYANYGMVSSQLIDWHQISELRSSVSKWTNPQNCEFPLVHKQIPANECVSYPWGGGVLGSIFAGYVPLASQSPYPITVYFVANYRPHLSHF